MEITIIETYTVPYGRTCHGCDGKGWVPNGLTGKPETCIICGGSGWLQGIGWQPYYVPEITWGMWTYSDNYCYW